MGGFSLLPSPPLCWHDSFLRDESSAPKTEAQSASANAGAAAVEPSIGHHGEPDRRQTEGLRRGSSPPRLTTNRGGGTAT